MKMSGNTCCVSAVLLLGVLISDVLPAQKPTTQQQTCVTSECHAEYAKNTYMHAPVGLGDCKACHEPIADAEHTWQLARKGRDLCESCHLDQASRKIIHEPLKTGECTECHDPHSSDNKFLLTEVSVAALCEKCHQVTKGYEFLHGPTAVGECTVCHNSHSSDHEGLLVAEHSELCFSCHVVTRDELQEYEFVHEPAKNDCIGCHDPHGAANPKMVKSASPQLCYPCHEDIQKIVENSKYRHTVVTGVDGCVQCHTPHASTARFLLKADAKSLCMTCHDKPQGISKDEILPAFTEQLKGMEFLHGPVAQNDCSGCHVSHGSNYFRLLAKNYPPIFYAPFSQENYELCFGCHENTLVLTAQTDGLTDFRNGNQNLHFSHVHKERRGRTCRACHQTHASNLPRHIRETVPYGTWNLPVGFTKTQTGGSCKSGCHLPKAYDRQNPIDYSVRPAATKKEPIVHKESSDEPVDANEV